MERPAVTIGQNLEPGRPLRGIGRTTRQNAAWSVFFVAAVLLCGCESRIEKAQREYDLAKRAGAGADELCRRGETITEAYLQAGNETDYRIQKLTAAIECQKIQLDEQNGIYNGLGGKPVDAGAAAREAAASASAAAFQAAEGASAAANGQ